MADRPPTPVRRVGLVGFRAARPDAGQPTPAEALARHLQADGVEVAGMVSTRQHRGPRLVDQLVAPLRWRRRADVVVVDVFSGRSFVSAEAATAAAGLVGLPVVLWLHGGNLPAFAEGHRRRFEHLLASAAAVVAPSGFLAELSMRHGREATIIPNTVELAAATWRDRAPMRPQLLWLRSFAPIYNPTLAVEVVAALVADHPEVQLTMAGADKGERAATEARAHALGVADRISFPGVLDAAARDRALDRCDVLLNTNDVDNMPVSLLEAMACGLVVVTTDAGGIPAMVTDGVDAAVRPRGDAGVLAAAVHDVLVDPELARHLAAGGRRRTAGLSWREVGPAWHAALAGAADGDRVARTAPT